MVMMPMFFALCMDNIFMRLKFSPPPLQNTFTIFIYLDKNEIQILLKIGNNPNITQLLGYSKDYSCMLMEFMPFGNLFYILEIGPLPKSIAKTLLLQLANTLQFLHLQGIIHGDIKPENMLISHQYRVKLCDFGFASNLNSSQSRRSIGGSIGYIAPEIYLSKSLDLTQCDIFSLGVVFFIMVTGYPPFQNNNPNVKDDWWALIKNKHWDQYWAMLTPIEEGFKDLIQRWLTNDQMDRITLSEILSNQWLNHNFATDQELAMEIKKKLEFIQKKKKFQ